jgi:hypothetical protein
MYIIKNYLTDETVAIVTRKEDAVAMTQGTLPNEPRLIFEEKKVDNTKR